MKAIAITYTPVFSKVNAALAAVIALSVLLYGIFLLEAVANTAKRTAAERDARALSADTSDLEGQYLAHTKSLTLEKAAQLGYVAPEHTTTVFAVAGSRALSAATPVR
ncbi:MAG TPA: hypothetical protein VHD37_00315 [Candidatus Paceibacterota bacterium]|nr:hypothetical protein [Candidatus Paceibacterota bacterium]